MHTEHWKTNIHSIIIVHFSGEQRPLPVLGMWGTDRQTMIIDDLIFSITACSIGVVLDSSWRLNNMNSIRSWSVEEHSIIIVSPFFSTALYPGLRSWFSRKNRLFFKNKNRSHIFAPFENKPLSLSNDEFMHIQLPHYEYLVSKRNIGTCLSLRHFMVWLSLPKKLATQKGFFWQPVLLFTFLNRANSGKEHYPSEPVQ